MSKVVVDSLQYTSWAGPLQAPAHAPEPSASGPAQPKPPGQGLRPPPRLPKPPPVPGDSMFGDAAFDGAVAQGEILAGAAVDGVSKLFRASPDVPRRELLLSRRNAPPSTALRRVHARSARRLLQHEKVVESNNTPIKLDAGTILQDTANGTLGSLWLHEVASGEDSIDGLHVALAVALVAVFFILAVGVLRGWWSKKKPGENTGPLQYAELVGEKAHKTSNYDI